MNVIVMKSKLIATVLGLALAYAGPAAAGKILNVVEHPEEGRNEAYLSFHSAATSDVILDSDPDDVSRHNPLTGTYTVRLGDLFPFSNPLTGGGTGKYKNAKGTLAVSLVDIDAAFADFTYSYAFDIN